MASVMGMPVKLMSEIVQEYSVKLLAHSRKAIDDIGMYILSSRALSKSHDADFLYYFFDADKKQSARVPFEGDFVELTPSVREDFRRDIEYHLKTERRLV